jgi:hypothetical protein
MSLSKDSIIEDLKDPKYPQTLQDPLKSFFQTALRSTDAAADELELLVRPHLASLTASAAASSDNSIVDDDDKLASVRPIGQFWRDCLQLCFHVTALEDHSEHDKRLVNVRKLPFVLLEDVLDYLTVDQCKLFWKYYLEESSDLLFSDRLWTPQKSRPCWLPFLKVCNHFIRRLEVVWKARIMETLARVFPLSEKSASMKWGSRNIETLTELVSPSDYQEEHEDELMVGSSQPAAAAARAQLDYNFYESFWSLQ